MIYMWYVVAYLWCGLVHTRINGTQLQMVIDVSLLDIIDLKALLDNVYEVQYPIRGSIFKIHIAPNSNSITDIPVYVTFKLIHPFIKPYIRDIVKQIIRLDVINKHT